MENSCSPTPEEVDVAVEMLAGRGADRDRVRSIVENTLCPCGGAIAFSPDIMAALESMPADEALKLFETTDLGCLEEGQSLVAYLYAPEAPLYTLEQLRVAIDEFIVEIEEQSEQLIAKGFVTKLGGGLGWLELNLGKGRCCRCFL